MATQQQKGTQGGGAGGERRSSASGSGTGASSSGEMQETMSRSNASASSSSDSTSTMGTTGGHTSTTGAGSTSGSLGRTGNGESGSSEPSQLMRQVRSTASDAYSTVTSKAAEKLEEQKSTLTGGLHNMAGTIRQLGDELSHKSEEDRVARLASDYSSTAAEKIEQAARYFDTHDVNAIYRDVENYARNNAAIFVGGAFALGFLLARFAKSSTSAAHRGDGAMSGTARRGNGSDIGSDMRTMGH